MRKKHPEFVYEKFDYKFKNKILKIKFHFHIAPNIDLFPTLEIPFSGEAQDIDSFVFHLGLIEMISYWKATCSPKIVIKAGGLNDKQISWWIDLFINGLGEFFYQNKIDFRQNNFLTINSKGKKYHASENKKTGGELILIGGGKDSAFTAELLKKENVLLVNPTPAALKIAKIAGFENAIKVKRTIDPTLLQLNKQGYLNGHTPFSAYLALLSVLVGRLYGFEHVIVSNEASAGEANLEYLGLSVNHQYSKSYGFEKKFRDYSKKYLSRKVNYFSFMRPLNELQITSLFALTKKYDKAFNSCNVGRGSYWCGACAKCAFVYLVFAALVNQKRIEAIFGKKDFFENKKINRFIRDLVGKGKHKPLDCVGTEEESRMAQKLIKGAEKERKEIINRIKNDWSNEHFLPEEYEKILKERIKSLSFRA